MSDEETPVEAVEAEAAPVEETPAVDTAAQEKERLGREAQKRIARLTYEREEAKREVARLKAAQVTATPATFDDQVNKTAAEMLAQQKFTEECNATFQKGIGEFPDFADSVETLQNIGMGQNNDFLDAVNDLPNGAAVLQHLAGNLEDAQAILKMKPGKMAVKLAGLSGELAKPNVKPLSKAPAPPESIGGRATPVSKNPENMPMGEFVKWFEEQRTNRR
jgi:hypothetical protein